MLYHIRSIMSGCLTVSMMLSSIICSTVKERFLFLLLVSDLWGDSLAQCEYLVLHQLQFQHQLIIFVNRHLWSTYNQSLVL